MGRSSNGATAVLLGLFLVLASSGCSGRGAAPPAHVDRVQLSLSLEPETHILDGAAKLEVAGSIPDTLYLVLHRDLKVRALAVTDVQGANLQRVGEGAAIADRLKRLGETVEKDSDVEHLALYALSLPAPRDSLEFELSYRGVVYDSVRIPSFSRMQIADETSGLIDSRGAFLTPWTGYYPRLAGDASLARFTTTVEVPPEWAAIAEGNIIERGERTVTFDSAHPLDGTYLVAGPYVVTSRQAGDVEVSTYFYHGSESLAPRYLAATAGYVTRYSDLFGPYAFERFSVVENWFPTGYGMPSYTLLGSQVIRLPFIIGTSLGHEVCHNWWGNGVLVDYKSGNWCEGLTVYCADYLYKTDKGPEAARSYRMNTLRDYADYVVRGDENDMALRDFTERTTPGTRTIGYGKAMMVFHMLHKRVGDEKFWEGLRTLYGQRKFTVTAWSDIFGIFSRIAGESFGWYERQWIDRAGAPQLVLQHPEVTRRGEENIVEFDLSQVQEEDPYRLDIPVRVTTVEGDTIERTLRDVRGRMYHARIQVPGTPDRLEVDPGFDVFRVLAPEEAPASLAGFFGEDTILVITPDTGEPMASAYRSFAEELLRGRVVQTIAGSELETREATGGAMLFLGELHQGGHEGQGRLTIAGESVGGTGLAGVTAWRDETDPTVTHLAVWGESPKALKPLGAKLPHYGKYSYLAFSSGQNILKGQWKVTSSPLMVVLSQGTN